jgi:hypothetical protein
MSISKYHIKLLTRYKNTQNQNKNIYRRRCTDYSLQHVSPTEPSFKTRFNEPLPLLLRVDSLLHRCVYCNAAQQRARRGPQKTPRVRFRGIVFTVPLLAMNCFGFQASCHNMKHVLVKICKSVYDLSPHFSHAQLQCSTTYRYLTYRKLQNFTRYPRFTGDWNSVISATQPLVVNNPVIK